MPDKCVFNYGGTFGRYVAMNGAENPPILAMREQTPTPVDLMVVGYSSAV